MAVERLEQISGVRAFIVKHFRRDGKPRTTLVYPDGNRIRAQILRDSKLLQEVRGEANGLTLEEELLQAARNAKEKAARHGAKEGWAFLTTDVPEGYLPQNKLKKLINPTIYGFPDKNSNSGALVNPPSNMVGTALFYLSEQFKMAARSSSGQDARWKIATIAFCSEEDLPSDDDLAKIAKGCRNENPLILTVRPNDIINAKGETIIAYDQRVIKTNLAALNMGSSIRRYFTF